MKQNAKIAMIMWITIIALIHIAYLIIIRRSLSAAPVSINFNAGISSVQKPVYYDLAPRYITDHFIHSFCVCQYFLFIHLWFAYECYYEHITNRNQHKMRIFMKREMLALWGTILPYIILWIGNTSDLFLLPVGYPIFSIYAFIIKLGVSCREYYWDYLAFIVILAPIILSFIIYVINFIIRYIKYRTHHCLDKKWKWWNITYILFLLILISWAFDAMQLYDKIPHLPIHDRIVEPIYWMFS